MVRTARRLSVALLACALSRPAPAEAFNRSVVLGSNPPIPLYWCKRSVPFVINERGSKSAGTPGLEAARLGFSAWSGPTCSDLTFEDKGTTGRLDVGFDASASDNVNLLVWRETNCAQVVPSTDPCLEEGGCNNRYGCWEDSTQAIAVTTTTYNKRTGEIYDSDIEFNGAGFAFSTVDAPTCTTLPTGRPACVATDIQSTTTHEVGHVLGLDHVDLAEATMFFEADFGETKKRSLHQDDVDGLCAVYPQGAATAECVQGGIVVHGSCGCSSGPEQGVLGLGLATAVVLGLFRRRKVPPCSAPR